MSFLLSIIQSLIPDLISNAIKKAWERIRPKKKPLLENVCASLVLYNSKPSQRLAKIRFNITNPGPSKCNIKDVKLICPIPIPEVNLVAIGKWPKGDVNTEGVQKLPLLLPVDEPVQVFIHTENTNHCSKEQYPDTIEMQIFLNNHEEPLKVLLSKQSDGHQYKQG